MFWGLILKANKKYSQTVQKDFHLSAAALDLSKCGDNDVQVMLTSEEHTYLLCTLGKKTPQFNLDLNFKQGEQVSLSTKGEGIVHLTGYLIPDDEELFGGLDDEESELEEEVEEMATLSAAAKGKGGKQDRIAKKVAQKVNAKEVQQPADDEDDEMDESFKLPKDAKKKLENGDDEDDSDEDDSEDGEGDATLDGEEDDDDDSDDDDEDDDDDDDDDEDDSDEDDDSDEEEVEQPKAKVAKLEKKPSKQNGLENGKASSKELKKDDKSPSQQQQQQNKEESKTRTLQGGLVVEDIKVGSGTEAKPGKKIAVYYEGRLKKNNKIFDATTKGPGFKFALGRGEVIKGWDLGVTGMKVGGKRRLTVPHQLAYGTRGSPPTIPGNSTLVFDVELKNVF